MLVLKLDNLADDNRFNEPIKRVKNREELDKIVANEFLKYDKKDIVKRLRSEKIACGVLNSISDLNSHPQLRKVKTKIGDKEIELIASPSIVIGERKSVMHVPSIGQNSKHIRDEFND